MGQLVAVRAMQEAISLARESGLGAVSARNSSHCGACAYFVEMAVREGMVGVALTHTDAIMVPPGMNLDYDVAVLGGGNAALCAALTAREAGRSVVVVEGAPRHMRGGNSRHTRTCCPTVPPPTS
jgi:hypothetical protein